MFLFSVFCGDILNHFSGCLNVGRYYCSDVNSYFFQNIHIKESHLVFFNIFFAVLFAIFLTISIFALKKINKK